MNINNILVPAEAFSSSLTSNIYNIANVAKLAILNSDWNHVAKAATEWLKGMLIHDVLQFVTPEGVCTIKTIDCTFHLSETHVVRDQLVKLLVVFHRLLHKSSQDNTDIYQIVFKNKLFHPVMTHKENNESYCVKTLHFMFTVWTCFDKYVSNPNIDIVRLCMMYIIFNYIEKVVNKCYPELLKTDKFLMLVIDLIVFTRSSLKKYIPDKLRCKVLLSMHDIEDILRERAQIAGILDLIPE